MVYELLRLLDVTQIDSWVDKARLLDDVLYMLLVESVQKGVSCLCNPILP